MSSFKANKIYYLILDFNSHIADRFNEIFHMCLKSNLLCEKFEIETKPQLKKALIHIRNETKSRVAFPYIHIEAHGSKTGIVTKSGANISWIELEQQLSDINILSRNNLFVSSAACYSADLKYSLFSKPNIRAPFFGIIAPTKSISYEEVQSGYDFFFKTLIQTKNVKDAFLQLNNISKIKKSYSFNLCSEAFATLFNETLKTFTSKISNPVRLNAYALELIQYSAKQTGILPTVSDITAVSRVLKKGKVIMEELDKFRNYYFMIDLYPELESKFIKIEDLPDYKAFKRVSG